MLSVVRSVGLVFAVVGVRFAVGGSVGSVGVGFVLLVLLLCIGYRFRT